MEHLWAPWRMTYISNGDSSPGCIFCVKPHEQRDEENYILYRSSSCFVMMNLYPYNNGHLMIAPYQHADSIEKLDTGILTDIMTTAQLSTRALREAMHPQGFNMGINEGRIAGAGIADHMHFHIVPRWNGDTNFMPVLSDTKVMPEYLHQTYQQLLTAFQSVSAK